MKSNKNCPVLLLAMKRTYTIFISSLWICGWKSGSRINVSPSTSICQSVAFDLWSTLLFHSSKADATSQQFTSSLFKTFFQLSLALLLTMPTSRITRRTKSFRSIIYEMLRINKVPQWTLSKAHPVHFTLP